MLLLPHFSIFLAKTLRIAWKHYWDLKLPLRFLKYFHALGDALFPEFVRTDAGKRAWPRLWKFLRKRGGNLRSQQCFQAILRVLAKNIEKCGRSSIFSHPRFAKITNWDNRKKPQFLRLFCPQSHIYKDFYLEFTYITQNMYTFDMELVSLKNIEIYPL